jgi:hypothetical protein
MKQIPKNKMHYVTIVTFQKIDLLGLPITGYKELSKIIDIFGYIF